MGDSRLANITHVREHVAGARVDLELSFSKGARVHRGVWESSMDPWKPEEREDQVEESDNEEIEMIVDTLLEMVARRLNQCSRDILIHKK